MKTKFSLLCNALLLFGPLLAQVQPSGHWQNEQGIGANWARWKNQIYFVSLSENWKEYFEGQMTADDRIEGRLVKNNLLSRQRYESRLEMEYRSKGEIAILSPGIPDGSYTSSPKLRYLGYYSAYENMSRPVFDEKHRAWEVKTWFQDGDTIVSVFIWGGDPVFDKGILISADSLQIHRKMVWVVHPCYAQQVVQCKLFPDGMIRARGRNLDGSCKNSIDHAWEKTTYDRYGLDGAFLIGGQQIDAREVAIPPEVLQLKITAVHIAGHPVRADTSGRFGRSLKVNGRQDITFRYASAIQGLKLYHRLKGFETQWHENSADYTAKYARLPPGNYTFELTTDPEGLDVYGNTVTAPLQVSLPFYRQGWFYPLLSIVVAVFIFWGFRWRERQRRMLEGLRQRIARELHDDIGSTLSSIGMLTAAAKNRNRQRSADVQLDAIGRKAQEALDSIGDILWAMRREDISGEELAQRMKDFAQEILEACGIDVHFQRLGDAAALPMSPEQRKELYLLFKEAVNNAAKYSHAREVWVSIQNDKGQFHLEIRDNGCGFDPAAVQRGNGLSNMQRRAERLGGVLHVESWLGKGTRVRVVFPAKV